jgi:hypothetical protein
MVFGIPTTEHLRPRRRTSWNKVSKMLCHILILHPRKYYTIGNAFIYYLINYRSTFLSTITSNNINLVNTAVLKTVNNFGSVMPSPRTSEDSPASLVNVIHRFWCQSNSIFRIKSFISTLHVAHSQLVQKIETWQHDLVRC